jgi:biopolymer transport protein ExbB
MTMSSLVDLAGTGATWVLYLLIGLSALQLALMVERGVVFVRSAAPGVLKQRVRDALATGNLKAVAMAVAGERSIEARVVAAGVASADRGVDAADEIMHSSLVEQKLELERGLSFLGTLGNNAPFLGLFGTVLGIIHAFADLSASGSGQASRAVMSGISEALVSTAVGLIVALPAVAAFNVFQRSIKKRSALAEALGGELIAHLKSPAIAVRKAA